MPDEGKVLSLVQIECNLLKRIDRYLAVFRGDASADLRQQIRRPKKALLTRHEDRDVQAYVTQRDSGLHAAPRAKKRCNAGSVQKRRCPVPRSRRTYRRSRKLLGRRSVPPTSAGEAPRSNSRVD